MANNNPAQDIESSARELYEQTQRVRENIAEFGGAARRTVTEWEEVLRDQVTQRPYTVLGAAAAVGYVLGGGIPPLLVRVLLGAVGRIALENALISVTANRGES